MIMQQATRLCPECLTIDASFPLIPGCQSCKDVLAQDEFNFWNSPILIVEETEDELTPHEFMRRITSPWMAFINLITMV